MGDLLPKLRRALGLPDDATKAAITEAFQAVIDDEEDDAEMRDPRVLLKKLAEKRSAQKSISFTEALRELGQEQPALIRRVTDFYAREK